LPTGLRVEEFDGSAWVGIVPFLMAGVMRRPLPDMPGFSSFPELNVRTYVEAGGKPGVWFFSLDADSWPVVFGGRNIYHLPYFQAKMTHSISNSQIQFVSKRRKGKKGERAVAFDANYRPVGDELIVTEDSFEHWATERYCLYSHHPRRGLQRVNVHHRKWPLKRAEIQIATNDLLDAAGIAPLKEAPRIHYSSGVHVVSYPIEAVL
jgi:hypothetical protein